MTKDNEAEAEIDVSSKFILFFISEINLCSLFSFFLPLKFDHCYGIRVSFKFISKSFPSSPLTRIPSSLLMQVLSFSLILV